MIQQTKKLASTHPSMQTKNTIQHNNNQHQQAHDTHQGPVGEGAGGDDVTALGDQASVDGSAVLVGGAVLGHHLVPGVKDVQVGNIISRHLIIVILQQGQGVLSQGADVLLRRR